MAIFPAIMLAGYVILIVYFMSRGGYKQVHLDEGRKFDPEAFSDDDRFGISERSTSSTGIQE